MTIRDWLSLAWEVIRGPRLSPAFFGEPLPTTRRGWFWFRVRTWLS